MTLPLLLPMMGCAVSGWVTFSTHWLRATDTAQNATRLGLIYGSIAFEMGLALVVAYMKCPVRYSRAKLLVERVALLTLIILGEGLISLTRGISSYVAVSAVCRPRLESVTGSLPALV